MYYYYNYSIIIDYIDNNNKNNIIRDYIDKCDNGGGTGSSVNISPGPSNSGSSNPSRSGKLAIILIILGGFLETIIKVIENMMM